MRAHGSPGSDSGGFLILSQSGYALHLLDLHLILSSPDSRFDVAVFHISSASISRRPFVAHTWFYLFAADDYRLRLGD